MGGGGIGGIGRIRSYVNQCPYHEQYNQSKRIPKNTRPPLLPSLPPNQKNTPRAQGLTQLVTGGAFSLRANLLVGYLAEWVHLPLTVPLEVRVPSPCVDASCFMWENARVVRLQAGVIYVNRMDRGSRAAPTPLPPSLQARGLTPTHPTHPSTGDHHPPHNLQGPGHVVLPGLPGVRQG